MGAWSRALMAQVQTPPAGTPRSMTLRLIEPGADSPFWPVVGILASFIVALAEVVTLNLEDRSWWSLAFNCTFLLAVVVRYARSTTPLILARIKPRLG